MGKKKSSNKSVAPAPVNAGSSATTVPQPATTIHSATPKTAAKNELHTAAAPAGGGVESAHTSNPAARERTRPDEVPELITTDSPGARAITSVSQLYHHLAPGAIALVQSARNSLETPHAVQAGSHASCNGPLSRRTTIADALKSGKQPGSGSAFSAGHISSAATTGGVVAAPAWTGSSVNPASVPVTVVLGAAAQMDALLVAEAKATAAAHKSDKTVAWASAAKSAPTSSSTTVSQSKTGETPRELRLAQLTTLAKLLMWYCVDTARGAGTLGGSGGIGGSSVCPSLHNGSGGGSTSPSVHGSHPSSRANASTPPAVNTPAPTPVQGVSNTSNTDGASSGLNSWLGSRMSAGIPSVVGMEPPGISDEHLAAQLLRPSVEFLAQFACYTPPPPTTSASATAADEVRACAVWLFASLLTRFPGASLNACLPRLFPEEDVRRGPHVRHPLLHPLVWDPVEDIRAGAQTALGLLLRALHPLLQYAQEPRRDRQSFVSMATQSGALLLALHETLEWALAATSQPRSTGAKASSSSSPPAAAVAVRASVPQLLSTFSVTISETPYRRCSQCQRCVLRALELPVLRACLTDTADTSAAGPSPSTAATAAPSPLFLTGTTWLTHILRNDSLEAAACGVLFPGLGSTDATTTTTTAAVIAPTTKQQQQQSTATQLGKPDESGDILDMLLSHAPERVEMWSCVVQLARLHPSLLHDHFPQAVTASAQLLTTLTADVLSLSGDTAGLTAVQLSLQEPAPSSSSSSSPLSHESLVSVRRVVPTAKAFAECLRAWLHFMGYVWKSFDNNAEDPGFDPALEKNRASIAEKDVIHHTLLAPAMAVVTSMRTITRGCTATPGSASTSVLSSPSKGDAHRQRAGSRATGLALLLTQGLPHATEELVVALLRCVAQMGDEYAETLSETERTALVDFTACAVDGTFGETADRAGAASADGGGSETNEMWSSVQAEALTTIGMWAWQYPSLVRWYGPRFVSLAVNELAINTDPAVRAKAAFALSNTCARLAASYPPTSPTATSLASLAARQQYAAPINSTSAASTTATDENASVPAVPVSPSGGVRESPDVMLQLCNTAVQAVILDHVSAVQGHGIRMMNFLLQTLSTSELTSLELEEPEGQCAGHGFLHVLLDVLHPLNKHEAKLRWNAACALGMGIAREHLVLAEPALCAEAVDVLCVAVAYDRIFKVRTQSANALAMTSTTALPQLGAHSTVPAVSDLESSDGGVVDFTARVLRSLCAALESASATENFRQYREQGPLLESVRAALRQLLATAQHSRALDKVMETYKTLLTTAELL